MKNDGNRIGNSHTFKRLANQVRSKVRKYISVRRVPPFESRSMCRLQPQEHVNEPTTNPYWAVGDTHGRITAADLELLAIVYVSQGAVMPILKLRDGFGAAFHLVTWAYGLNSNERCAEFAHTMSPYARSVGDLHPTTCNLLGGGFFGVHTGATGSSYYGHFGYSFNFAYDILNLNAISERHTATSLT